MPDPNHKRPTIMDVAKLSGVSYQTVSRVLNRHPHVSKDSRLAVEAAIEQLGYHPNKSAARLASKRSNMVAVVALGGSYFGPSQMALSIDRAARQAGYDVTFSHITNSYDSLVKAVHHLSGWDVDGILMIASIEGLSYAELQGIAPPIPIVEIDGTRGMNIPSVVIDDAGGMRAAIEHLTNLGHSRFVEITGPLDWFSAQIRHQTCEDMLPTQALLASAEGDWTAAGGYYAAKTLMKHSFSAMIVANDQMALGALCALQEAGIRVPQDVSLVGFDDIPEAAYYQPPLTTIRQDFQQLGMVGIEYLLQLVADPETPIQQHLINPSLVIRQSTALPPPA